MKKSSKFEQLKQYITKNAQNFIRKDYDNKCEYTYKTMEFDALYLCQEIKVYDNWLGRILGLTGVIIGEPKSGGIERGLFIKEKQVELSQEELAELWSILENRYKGRYISDKLLQNLKRYVKKNALKFKRADTYKDDFCLYKYGDVEIYMKDMETRLVLCNQRIIASVDITDELFNIVKSIQDKRKENKKNKAYANCIKKINKDAK